MIFLAFLDYMFQRFTYLKNLRMTKQEVKDERKDTEGNPQIKQRVRNVQMEMMKRRMMSAVPEADVIITNPDAYFDSGSIRSGKFGCPGGGGQG